MKGSNLTLLMGWGILVLGTITLLFSKGVKGHIDAIALIIGSIIMFALAHIHSELEELSKDG